MPRPQKTRRIVPKTIGAGFVAGAFSVPASAGNQEFTEKLNTVRALTRKYRNIETARDDDLTLDAVERLLPGDQEDNPSAIFSDEDSHRNQNVTEEDGWHFEAELDFTGLHAMVHRGNPEGVFHHTNPNLD